MCHCQLANETARTPVRLNHCDGPRDTNFTVFFNERKLLTLRSAFRAYGQLDSLNDVISFSFTLLSLSSRNPTQMSTVQAHQSKCYPTSRRPLLFTTAKSHDTPKVSLTGVRNVGLLHSRIGCFSNISDRMSHLSSLQSTRKDLSSDLINRSSCFPPIMYVHQHKNSFADFLIYPTDVTVRKID